MANATGIEWCDFSSNPLRYRNAAGKVVWGCVKVSSGCAHCYSEAVAQRFDKGGPYTNATMATLTPFLDEKELKHLLTAKKLAGKRVFLGDMTDVFGEWVGDKLLDQLFAAMALRRDVTFQVLTKRAGRMREYATEAYRAGAIQDACRRLFDRMDYGTDNPMPWPLPNVWLGTSVENQAAADERIPHLLRTPATVRFLSCEPLLGPVDLRPKASDSYGELGRQYRAVDHARFPAATDRVLNCFPRIDWVIVGGESGHGSRPFQLDWARSIQNQCDAANVPWFFKQAGANPHDWTRGDAPNHEPPELVQLRLKDKKGGDLSELPSALRVREFPAPVA